MYKFVGARELDLVVLVAISLFLALFSFFLWKKKRSSKSTRRGRGDVSVSFDIPLELQIEILTRLPAKSLMRFKCVSKLWFSLIRSRYVSNHYLTVAPPPRPPRLYVSLVEQHECDSMEVCHDRGKSLLVSFSSSSSNNAESFDQDLTITGMGGHNMVALRRLILYRVCGKACIYNPATRQSLTLPAVESNIIAQEEPHKYVEYFLGHDPVLDQYKVVCTFTIASKGFERITSEHWVFVLEAGGSWKRIEFNQQPHRARKLEVCINGVIYYLASTSTHNDILVSFDVKSEEYSIIQAPRDVTVTVMSVDLIEYGGKPAILDHTYLTKNQYSDLIEYGLMELWVLEDGGKWSRKSMVLQPRHMHLVENIVGVMVIGTTRSGEVILAPLSEPFYCCILYYDMRKNDLRKVEIRGMPNEFIDPCTYLTLMDKNESIMHLET